jgi:hypothetical protein
MAALLLEDLPDAACLGAWGRLPYGDGPAKLPFHITFISMSLRHRYVLKLVSGANGNLAGPSPYRRARRFKGGGGVIDGRLRLWVRRGVVGGAGLVGGVWLGGGRAGAAGGRWGRARRRTLAQTPRRPTRVRRPVHTRILVPPATVVAIP